jgi:hypothetical protein
VYLDKTRYVIIQIPPKLIMGAMIKNISRICAVFERVEAGAEEEGEGGSTSGDSSGGGGGGGGGGFRQW